MNNNVTISSYTSDKIRLLSLILIIFVLYIHSGFHTDEIEGMVMNDKVQEFISGMMGRCAVPLFYVISGYLFFLKVPDGMTSIYGKMKKRVRTLVVPYIIGCLFFIGFGVLMAVLPGVSIYMNSSVMPLFSKPLEEILRSIFYDAGNGYPCAFQLWFLRDLILIVATSPLWYLCLKHLKWGFVAVVFVLTYLDVPHVPFYSLFWFVLGGQFTKVRIESKGKNGIITIELLALCLFIVLSIVELVFPDIVDWSLLRIPIILFGILGAWGLYDVVIRKEFSLSQHRWLATACHFTFFIYLFHEPTLNIVRKLIVVIIGRNDVGYLVSYLLSPWIFIIVSIPVAAFLKRHFVSIYKVCVGYRI